MSDFSIGDAVGAGFKLITKRPASVLAWAVVYLILAVGPGMAHFSAIQPVWTEEMKTILSHMGSGSPPDPAEIQNLNMRMLQSSGFAWLAMLGGLLSWGILTGAIYRSILEPKNSSFFSLRFGVQELWLILLAVVAYILLVVIIIVDVFAAAFLTGIAVWIGSTVHGSWGGLATGLLIFAVWIAAVAVPIWVVLRLSMAGPLTFVDRQFRLFESWKVTKGRVWKLLGLSLLMVLIVIGIEFAVAIVTIPLTLGAVGAHGFDPSRIGDFLSNLTLQNPIVLIGLVVRALIGAAFLTIWVAPWAYAYRELAGRSRDAASVF